MAILFPILDVLIKKVRVGSAFNLKTKYHIDYTIILKLLLTKVYVIDRIPPSVLNVHVIPYDLI